MTPIEVGILGTAVMVVMLLGGIPVGVSMGLVGFGGFAFLMGLTPALGLLKTVPYSTAASYALSVIPLFVLMGELSFQSGISRDIYKAAHRWFGHLLGGLAMATIGAGAGFGAMCGSGMRTAVGPYGAIGPGRSGVRCSRPDFSALPGLMAVIDPGGVVGPVRRKVYERSRIAFRTRR